MSFLNANGLTTQEAQRRLSQFGKNEIIEKEKPLLLEIAAELWQPVPWMLEAAIVLQIAIGECLEAAVITGLLLFNVALGRLQQGKARAALDILKSRLSVRATVKRDGVWAQIAASELAPGDIVKLEIGALVPADARLIEGSILLDQSMLTGESAPVEIGVGAIAYSGAIARRGEAVAEVVATGARSYYGKSAELVRVAGAKSAQQEAILGVVQNLAVFNGAVTVLLIAYGHRLSMPAGHLVALTLTAVLASIPVALPATFTLVAALGAQALARKGVLLTRLSAVHEAAMIDVICVDKTGTLTSNQLGVAAVAVVTEEFTEADVLRLAAFTSAVAGVDPVDAAIRAAALKTDRASATFRLRSFIPFDPATKIAEATVVDEAGAERRIVKGAPLAIARLSPFPAQAAQQIDTLSRAAGRVIAVAFGLPGAEKLVGLIALSDPPRAESKPLIAKLRDEGVRTVMVTGDAAATAASVGHAVGLDGPVCSAEKISPDTRPEDFLIYAGVFPEDKFRLVQAFQRQGHTVGMCGDGVNDAPALKQAQMGVAVSTATDVAKSAASVVLTEPGLTGMVAAIEEGRAAFQRILTYTLNALVKKFQLVPFLGVGLLATGHAIVTPMQMALLLITGDFLTMAIATDKATPSAQPDAWRLGAITGAAGTIAFAGLLFLSGVVLVGGRLLSLDMGEMRTLAFVALVFLGQATVYVLRDRGRLWRSAPSRWLVASSLLNVAIAIVLALGGYLMKPLPVAIIAKLLLATVVFALLLDLLKAPVYAAFGLTAAAKAEAARKLCLWVLPAGAAGIAGIAAVAVGLWSSSIEPTRRIAENSSPASSARSVILRGKVLAAPEQLVTAERGGTIGAIACVVGEQVEVGRLCATILGEPSQRAVEKREIAQRNLAIDERLLSSLAGGRAAHRSTRLRRALLARERKQQHEIDRLLIEEKRSREQTLVRAPFDSVVVARYASPGQKVAASAPLFLFARGSPAPGFEFDAPTEALAQLRVGTPVEISSDTEPGQVIRSKILRITGATPGVSGVGHVIVEGPENGPGFAAGSSVLAKIELPRENAPSSRSVDAP